MSLTSEDRSTALTEAALRAGLPRPTVFTTEEGGRNFIWQSGAGRVTVYLDPDQPMEVEVVPHGPVQPFTTGNPDEAAAKVVEYLRVWC